MKDPWRERCPEGHCSVEQYGDGYYCQPCDEVYDHLLDIKTGRPVQRGVFG